MTILLILGRCLHVQPRSSVYVLLYSYVLFVSRGTSNSSLSFRTLVLHVAPKKRAYAPEWMDSKGLHKVQVCYYAGKQKQSCLVRRRGPSCLACPFQFRAVRYWGGEPGKAHLSLVTPPLGISPAPAHHQPFRTLVSCEY